MAAEAQHASLRAQSNFAQRRGRPPRIAPHYSSMAALAACRSLWRQVTDTLFPITPGGDRS